MKHLFCALLGLLILSFVPEVKAGGTGNPYIYTFPGSPVGVAVASLNPPQGALILDTTNNVWRLKTSLRGSNAGYDTFITGTAGTALVNAVLTTPTVTGEVSTSGTFITPTFGVATGTSLAVTAGLTSSGATGAGIGYATGAGGAITQATNRTTGVTLSKLSGQITTNNASLAAEAAAAFVVTDTTVAIGDAVVVSIQSGSNGGNTMVQVTTVTNGSFTIQVCNNNPAAGTAETGAIIINYAIVKSVAN